MRHIIKRVFDFIKRRRFFGAMRSAPKIHHITVEDQFRNRTTHKGTVIAKDSDDITLREVDGTEVTIPKKDVIKWTAE